MRSQINEGNWFYAVRRFSWFGFTIVRQVPLIVIQWSQKSAGRLDFASK